MTNAWVSVWVDVEGVDDPSDEPATHPFPHRDTYSKYVAMFLLHPGEEAGSISPKLQGMAQPGDAAQVQGRLAWSPAETTALSPV